MADTVRKTTLTEFRLATRRTCNDTEIWFKDGSDRLIVVPAHAVEDPDVNSVPYWSSATFQGAGYDPCGYMTVDDARSRLSDAIKAGRVSVL